MTPSSTGVTGEIAITIPLPPLPPLPPPVAIPMRGVPVPDLDTGGAGGVPRLTPIGVRSPQTVVRRAVVAVSSVRLALQSQAVEVSAGILADHLLAVPVIPTMGQSAIIAIDQAVPVALASGVVHIRGIQNPSDEDLLLWFLGILP